MRVDASENVAQYSLGLRVCPCSWIMKFEELSESSLSGDLIGIEQSSCYGNVVVVKLKIGAKLKRRTKPHV